MVGVEVSFSFCKTYSLTASVSKVETSAIPGIYKKQENDDRVMMMTFSEFGRRVEQNASGGTDHGAAAPMFLMGPKLKQGVVGKHPSLTDLDSGDLKYSIDFRTVYATVMQNWLDAPSKPILGAQFQTIPILKA